ncbi:hypothetical protein HELRODRAFT_167838 [Helobdella robusta]|uniref:Uncharacterized protein n=1 Tax=Helobdella robusta TaxID=6412 RepID=T1EZV1_HELRO|nr:hypothetical protein HELRODRAFT_167838 [Helobdella robusta]ESO10001.1 hypothetical protein HELRODRAFT_167838 [Helobdella robusta]
MNSQFIRVGILCTHQHIITTAHSRPFVTNDGVMWQGEAGGTKVVWCGCCEFVISIQNEPLVGPQKVLIPPLRINLGLMKRLVKALDQDGQCFKYLYTLFPALSCKKLKAGIFDSPQIILLIKDKKFIKTMIDIEKHTWHLNFPTNFVAMSDEEQGERFHQDINTMERRYKGRWNTSMIANYPWCVHCTA